VAKLRRRACQLNQSVNGLNATGVNFAINVKHSGFRITGQYDEVSSQIARPLVSDESDAAQTLVSRFSSEIQFVPCCTVSPSKFHIGCCTAGLFHGE